VRQGIDSRDGQREERIVLVGEAEAMSLDPEAKPLRVPVEGRVFGRGREGRQLLWREEALADLVGAQALADELHGAADRDSGMTWTGSAKAGPVTMT
jgi:hypothetical protein